MEWERNFPLKSNVPSSSHAILVCVRVKKSKRSTEFSQFEILELEILIYVPFCSAWNSSNIGPWNPYGIRAECYNEIIHDSDFPSCVNVLVRIMKYVSDGRNFSFFGIFKPWNFPTLGVFPISEFFQLWHSKLQNLL